MLRTIIIDDELIGINTLKVLIEKNFRDVKVVASTTDPDKGITLIEDYKPEIVLLDISMPKISGFDVLNRLIYKDFKLVFTTAHGEYALKAIKNHAFDFLLKPIDADEFRNCISMIVDEKFKSGVKPSDTHLHIIELPVKDGIIFIKQQDVIRLEASGSYTVFYLVNNIKHIASKNLKECEAMLDHDIFFRCHLSHIINLQKVTKMVSANGLFAQMIDGSMPEIGKKNKETFLAKLKQL